MIDALITGRLASAPKAGTSRNGNAYATCRVWVSTGGDDSLSVGVIAFDTAAVSALLALTAGDSVALAGELTPKVWESSDGPRPSADLKAHAVLTPYHVTRRRKAMQSGDPG
ncbi:single-stranded DNA-binding protein [Luteimonas sp. SDU82]|uniref:single-stranded DNA-binding protein n=1 Tax=Luteimonas sp. SDU82 TaxID=3422592 RepID=UPI003EC0FD31